MTLFFILISMVLQEGAATDLQKSIQKVRTQKSYGVKYKAVVQAPQSDPLVIEGTSLWVKPGVLYVHYKASGGDEKRIVRVGEQVWIYHEIIEDWLTAKEMGSSGAGRGVQNPDEVLNIFLEHAKSVKAGTDETLDKRTTKTYGVSVTGREIENIIKEHSAEGAYDWTKSTASAKVWVDKTDGLIYKFTSEASLTSTDPEVPGKVKYTAEVAVSEFGKKTSLEFQVRDARTGKMKPLALSKKILEAIQKAGSR